MESITDFLKQYYHANEDQYLQQKGPNTLMALQVGHASLSIARLTQGHVDTLMPNGMPFKRYVASTVEVNNHLRNEDFRKALAMYNEVSQRLDASYIKRLTEIKPERPQDVEIQQKRLNELRVRMERMAKYGLTKTEEMIDTIPQQYSGTIELYIQDTQQKLDVIEPFYRKLRKFDDLINSRALAHKKMLLSPKGLVLKDENNVEVPLTGLSSGEQHLLILFYHLIFQTQPNSVIFIDEPEMSMHPAWLEGMLRDFKEIAQMNRLSLQPIQWHSLMANGTCRLTYLNCIVKDKRHGRIEGNGNSETHVCGYSSIRMDVPEILWEGCCFG